MMYIVFVLIWGISVVIADDPLLCPLCINECVARCDCTDCEGNVLTPPPLEPQLPPPKGCPACVINCPRITCVAPSTPCTPKQLETYVPKCPDCVPQAGCKQLGCDCKNRYGQIFTPAHNPPQPPRPDGCPACKTVCIESKIKCSLPDQCTCDQFDRYVPKGLKCKLNASKEDE